MNPIYIKNAVIVLVVCGVLGFASAADATSHPGQTQGYQLLAPLPGVSDVPDTGFAGYAQSVITFIIGFSAVLAVLMITVGGFLYMTGESPGMKADGKKKMWSAILGLLLLLASWLILNTINPDLLNLNLIIPKPTQNSPSASEVRVPMDFDLGCAQTITEGGKTLRFKRIVIDPPGSNNRYCVYAR